MLIEKGVTFDEGDLVTFKLTTNDEIMAKLVKQTDEAYVVEDPHFLVPHPSGEGMGLFPYLMTGEVEKPLELKKSHVVFAAPTKKEFKPAYTKSTTNIITPINKLV